METSRAFFFVILSVETSVIGLDTPTPPPLPPNQVWDFNTSLIFCSQILAHSFIFFFYFDFCFLHSRSLGIFSASLSIWPLCFHVICYVFMSCFLIVPRRLAKGRRPFEGMPSCGLLRGVPTEGLIHSLSQNQPFTGDTDGSERSTALNSTSIACAFPGKCFPR